MENYLIATIILGFLVVFPIFWCGTIYIVANLGGWQALAHQFPMQPEIKETKALRTFSGLNLKISLFGSYSGIVEAKLYPKGLVLSTSFFFKFGHPPIFIPRNAIASVKHRKLFFRDYLLIKTTRNSSFTVYGKVCKAILQWHESNIG